LKYLEQEAKYSTFVHNLTIHITSLNSNINLHTLLFKSYDLFLFVFERHHAHQGCVLDMKTAILLLSRKKLQDPKRQNPRLKNKLLT